MIKRSTWIILVLFLAALGTFLFLKYRPEPTPKATATSVASNYLFTEADGTLLAIRIFDKQYNIVELERTVGGLWSMTLPILAAADQSKAEAGVAQIGALLIVDTIDQHQSLASFGLDFPSYMVKLTFEDSGLRVLRIGNLSPTGSGYYVQVDDEQVCITSNDGIDAILNMLHSPPYPASTSTPVSIPDTTSTQVP